MGKLVILAHSLLAFQPCQADRIKHFIVDVKGENMVTGQEPAFQATFFVKRALINADHFTEVHIPIAPPFEYRLL
jgi:hypothetical protein